MPGLPPVWYESFQAQLFERSYEETVQVLLKVTSGRLGARTPFEVEVLSPEEVRITASPKLGPAEDADAETRAAVKQLLRDLELRDAALLASARAIVSAQADYLLGRREEPKRLDPAVIAAQAALSLELLERCAQNKLVIHPRGMSTLLGLLDPGRGPSALAQLAGRPKPPPKLEDAVESLIVGGGEPR
ncbi:MAG: hypothetical protein U1E65_23150 [Myxococcota bacterium]